MFKLFFGCQLQGLENIPALVFSEFHTARWIWDFVVIGALCWVTIFTPLQVAEKRQAIGREICDTESVCVCVCVGGLYLKIILLCV